jgi:hypothetical protein
MCDVALELLHNALMLRYAVREPSQVFSRRGAKGRNPGQQGTAQLVDFPVERVRRCRPILLRPFAPTV